MKRLFVFGSLLCCGLILIGFIPVVPRQLHHSSLVLQTRTIIKDLRIALEAFKIEYGHFPGHSVTSQSTDTRLLSTGPLIDCLLTQNAEWNPREIKFIDLPTARNGRFGYVAAEGLNSCRLVDLWGNPYVILLDTNDDVQVPNPDVENTDPTISQSKTSPPPPTLPFKTAIYSFGKDGIEGTVDDIVSWRSTADPSEASGSALPFITALIVLVLVIIFVRRLRISPAK